MAITKIPLFGSGVAAQSLTLNPSQMINFYEIRSPQESGDKCQREGYGTPGTSLYLQGVLGTNPCRGGVVLDGVLYVVYASTFYAVSPNGTALPLGTLGTTKGRVSVITNGAQIMISDQVKGYNYTLLTSVFAIITDPSFPVPAPYPIYYHEGRAVFFSPDSSTVICSNLFDFTTYNSLAFLAPQSDPQDVLALLPVQTSLMILGTQKSELWNLAANAIFPYSPNTSIQIQYGILAPLSAVAVNGLPFWLAQNEHGSKIIISVNYYGISQEMTDKHSSYQLSQMTSFSDAFAYGLQFQGSYFYCITFPTDNVTFLLNLETKQLSRWSSWSIAGYDQAGNANFSRGRQLGDHYFVLNGNLICSDYRNGNLLTVSNTTYTDFECGPDNSIYRQIISPIVSENRQRITLSYLEIDMETGNSPVPAATTGGNQPLMTVSLSKDGARTYPYQRFISSGNQGQYLTRAKLNNWGIGRDMAIMLETSHPEFAAIHGLIAEIETETE